MLFTSRLPPNSCHEHGQSALRTRHRAVTTTGGPGDPAFTRLRDARVRELLTITYQHATGTTLHCHRHRVVTLGSASHASSARCSSTHPRTHRHRRPAAGPQRPAVIAIRPLRRIPTSTPSPPTPVESVTLFRPNPPSRNQGDQQRARRRANSCQSRTPQPSTPHTGTAGASRRRCGGRVSRSSSPQLRCLRMTPKGSAVGCAQG
jgi:hypothetical protein